MKHLKQMTFPLFKELFDLQSGYRKINEDIAALRNIAWAALQRSDNYLDEEYASFTFDVANLLLHSDSETGRLIGSLLAGY